MQARVFRWLGLSDLSNSIPLIQTEDLHLAPKNSSPFPPSPLSLRLQNLGFSTLPRAENPASPVSLVADLVETPSLSFCLCF